MENEVKYSPLTTGKKTATAATTVSVAGILAVVITSKLHPVLTASGVDIDPLMLIVFWTSTLQSMFIAVKNWWKNRNRGK